MAVARGERGAPASHGSLDAIRAALPTGCTLRLATRADNAAILEFQSQHAMRAELGLRFDRSPDFFALLDAHSLRHETWLFIEHGCVKAMGTVVIRSAYVAGGRVTAAYLGELRIPPHRVASRIWVDVFRQVLDRLRT